MKKWINDLTFDEVKKFLSHNQGIDGKVFNRALDDAYFWVGEYLYGVPRESVDYAYFGRGEHFTVKDVNYKFMRWIDGMQRDYEWLDESTYNKCKQAYELWEADKVRDLSDEEWEEYDTLKDEIGDEIFALMKSEYWAAFEDDNRAETFIQSTEDFFDEDPGEIYVDTDTWDWYVADFDDETLDSELNEQLELPMI